MTLEFSYAHDLRTDPHAIRVVRRPTPVVVCFAAAVGTLATPEGPVHYSADAALVCDGNGRRWPVERAVFETRYTPLTPTRVGEAGRYRHVPETLLGRRIGRPFRAQLPHGRGFLKGAADDWLIQYAPGELGVVSAAAFSQTYDLDE